MPRALHLTHAEWEHATDHLICALSGRLEALGTSRSPLELPSSSSRAARSRCGVPQRRACVPHAAERVRSVVPSRSCRRAAGASGVRHCVRFAHAAVLRKVQGSRRRTALVLAVHRSAPSTHASPRCGQRAALPNERSCWPSASASSRQRAFAADVVSEIAVLVESTHALCSGSVAFGSCDVL